MKPREASGNLAPIRGLKMLDIKQLKKENDILRNKAELLQEDIDCIHMWLDANRIPRFDGFGNIYSIVGRIEILISKQS